MKSSQVKVGIVLCLEGAAKLGKVPTHAMRFCYSYLSLLAHIQYHRGRFPYRLAHTDLLVVTSLGGGTAAQVPTCLCTPAKLLTTVLPSAFATQSATPLCERVKQFPHSLGTFLVARPATFPGAVIAMSSDYLSNRVLVVLTVLGDNVVIRGLIPAIQFSRPNSCAPSYLGIHRTFVIEAVLVRKVTCVFDTDDER